MSGSCNDSSQPFAKTICSICYEDLKPIVEDLQSISNCGHVFHELCIQQWFEYCSKGKKKCPICKQTCSASNVSRLYFQSVGDTDEPKLSQKQQARKEDLEEVQLECRRLEGKVKCLNSALESRENDLKNITNELCECREQLKKEAALKSDALEQTHTINRLLNMKTQELNKSDLECIKLQERNMALAKELAALKLVSDLNLEEDEIVRLASLGTQPHSKDSVDVLKKSLVARNKMYKELIAKCNTLGRDEARSRKELEKAKEKVEKLKMKIQEMETAHEMKENEALRSLKASKKTNHSPSTLDEVDPTFINKSVSHNTIKEPYLSEAAIGQVAAMPTDLNSRTKKRLRGSENIDESIKKNGACAPCPGVNSYILIDDDTPEVSVPHEFSTFGSVHQPIKSVTRPEHEKSKHNGVLLSSYVDGDCMLFHEDVPDKPLPDISIENPPVVPASQEGDLCFSAGLLGPDGTRRHLGKWCKKAQNKGFNTSAAPTQASGDLIAVGSDGRGGRIKVLRSQNPSSLESSKLGKNGKSGSKTSSLQSRGSLQIDHFFRKADQ